MPTKSVKRKIKGQSAVNVQNTKDKNDSIETVTPSLSHEDQEDKIKGSSKKRRVNKTELALSPTRRSPRLLTQKSKFTRKPPLKLALSPSLPVRNSRPVSTPPQLPPPLPALPPLPINTRNSQQQPLTGMETSPSYHTAPASPIESTPNLSMPVQSPTTHTKDNITPENEAASFIREVPSSLPWENTPSDGYGDAWPPSQDSPKSSQHKTPTHSTQPRYNDGFRVPDPPSSRSGLDDTQDESQASQLRSPLSRVGSLQHSPPKPTSQHRQTTTLRIPDPINWSKDDLDETQDDSQVEPAPIRKRKREPTINEIPDSIPSDDSISQPKSSPQISHSKVEEDSLVVLSQPPAFMRKRTPEVITIHSTQSQSQEYITAPGPRATSQSLSQPFARTNSDDSQASYIYPPQHNWASSQPTQSSLDPIMDMNLTNPPSQHPLSSQNDLSRIPEPLAMTLDHGIPRKKSYDDWPDLDEMERLQDMELQKWEAETNHKLKRKDTT
jgi:hypothetical protein